MENAAIPQLFLWDGPGMWRVRKRILAGDTRFAAVLEALVADAERALDVGPFSVTDKEILPPSGDPHDYMSMGPYWWPNPDTPDGLPYVRRDGVTNPERDQLDQPRVVGLASAVETLSLAWYFTGEEKYAERAALLLRTWFLDEATKMNPHLEYGQGIPGRVEGRGIGIIDTARRFSMIVDAVGLLDSSEAWTDGDRLALAEWFRTYLTWLIESEKGIDEARQPNNHGTHYDTQAICLALFTGDTDTARRILEEVPERRIASQIEPDGKQPWELRRTLSHHYSTMNLVGMFNLATLGEHLDIDLWNWESEDGRGIRKALDFLLGYIERPEEWEWEDLRGLNWSQYPELLRRAARAYNEPDLKNKIPLLEGIDHETDRSNLLYPGP